MTFKLLISLTGLVSLGIGVRDLYGYYKWRHPEDCLFGVFALVLGLVIVGLPWLV